MVRPLYKSPPTEERDLRVGVPRSVLAHPFTTARQASCMSAATIEAREAIHQRILRAASMLRCHLSPRCEESRASRQTRTQGITLPTALPPPSPRNEIKRSSAPPGLFSKSSSVVVRSTQTIFFFLWRREQAAIVLEHAADGRGGADGLRFTMQRALNACALKEQTMGSNASQTSVSGV